MEASRGIYKPIRVLFSTPIYDMAVKICWHLPSYRAQIAIMMEFLRLQQEHLISSNITAEDLRDFLVEKSKETVREQLWEFNLEAFEDKEAKPLLRLVWAVNNINKMRDVEFQARMLLKFPEAIPPKFQTPKLLSMVKEYVEVLEEKQREPQSAKMLTAEEVVIEVVPRVLQGFWELPPCPLLNMASKSLSILSTSVTKATLDHVSKTVTAMESQAFFSRTIREDMVQSILTEIRERYPEEVLLNNIGNFAPGLLKTIADVAKNHVINIFKPPSSLQMSDVPHTEEPLSDSLSTPDVPAVDELPSGHVAMLNVLSSEELHSESPPFLDVPHIEEPHSGSLSMPDVPAIDELLSENVPMLNVGPSEELHSESPPFLDVPHIEEPHSESLSTPDVPAVDELPSGHVAMLNVLSSEEVHSESLSVPNVLCEEPSADTASMSESAERES